MGMIYKRGKVDLIIVGQERGFSADNQGVS
jgi:hypothetical protein